MTSANPRAALHRLGLYGAASTLLGAVLSGPVAMAVVTITRPQPPWASAQRLSDNYHPVQVLPFLNYTVQTTFVPALALVVVMAALAIAVFRRRLCGFAEQTPLSASPSRALPAGAP